MKLGMTVFRGHSAISDGPTDVADYFLRSERLGFRRWTEEDFDLALGLWGDLEVTKLIDVRGQLTEEQVRERLSKELATEESYGVQYWPIFLLANDEHVGCCGLRPYDLTKGIYEIGFHIRPSHWRSGFALEAACTVMEYGFTRLRAAALFAGHNPKNDVSRRLLEKLGFRYSHNEYYPTTGLNHPSYLLAAEEYIRWKKDHQ